LRRSNDPAPDLLLCSWRVVVGRALCEHPAPANRQRGAPEDSENPETLFFSTSLLFSTTMPVRPCTRSLSRAAPLGARRSQGPQTRGTGGPRRPGGGQGGSSQFPGGLVGTPRVRVRKCHQMSSKEHIQLGWVVRRVLSTPPGHPAPRGSAVCTCRASTSLAPLYSPCASSPFG
jgi:hypothetical protein